MGLNVDCLMKSGLPISGSSFVEMFQVHNIEQMPKEISAFALAVSFNSKGGAAA
jgi:hypothetical protein